VEVTLPGDYQPGRPVRLRGMGRRFGPWKGDLYLRIIPK
jgi:molecular chaperone DnaJ